MGRVRFSAAEPATVLIAIAGQSAIGRVKLQRRVRNTWRVSTEFRASWALDRQWAGQDAACSAQREAEIRRTRTFGVGCHLRDAEGWSRPRGKPAPARD